MKTAKKLFSLLLVAVLLFSALPFQAMAASTPLPRKIVFLKDDGNTHAGMADVVNGVLSGSIPTTANVTSDVSKELVGWKLQGKSGTILMNTNNIGAENLNFADTEWLPTSAYEYVHAIPVLGNKTHVCTFPEAANSVTAATCYATGLKTWNCNNPVPLADGSTCHNTKTEVIPQLDHLFGNWQVTTPAGPLNAGVETGTCQNNGCTATTTRPIDKTAIQVTFIDEKNDTQYTVSLKVNEAVGSLALVTPEPVENYEFLYWVDADGNKLQNATDVYRGENTVYTAYWTRSTNDKVSRINVYYRPYVDGKATADARLLYSDVVKDGTRVVEWLDTQYNRTWNGIFSRFDKDEYNWGGYYYDYYSDEQLTQTDVLANGDRDVIVKVMGNKDASVKVLLYVHDKVESGYDDIIQMNGYSVGKLVGIQDVKNAIKNRNNGKVPTIKNDRFYTDSQWDQLLDGESPSGTNGYTITSKDTVILHVIVTGYSASASSKPASNPSTGDMIEATAAVMFLAAAAVVTLTQLRKRKMI